MKWTIYCHINKINGKKYIGQTTQTLKNRSKNGWGYKRSPRFFNAIQKYGWDNFEHEIITTCDSYEEANKLETLYILLLRTNDERYGYNITSGGEGSTGAYHSEESKHKMSESKKGSKNPSSKPVRCIETGEVFECAADAGRKYTSGLSTPGKNIGLCCKGILHTCGGVHWEYVLK